MNRQKVKSSVHEGRCGNTGPIPVPTVPLTIVVALLVCAFLWPSEAAIFGEGLHLALLWVVSLAGMCLWCSWLTSGGIPRQSPTSGGATGVSVQTTPQSLFSPGRLVVAGLILFLVGTWLSTLNVFRVAGDRRAALNLAFEWTGIAACGCMCWWWLRDQASKVAVVTLIAGIGIGLAVFAIWHSHTFYKQAASSYLEKRQRLDELEASGANPSEVWQIRQEFLRSDIPLSGQARELVERRLLESSEPFGPFALANTLAGVLAATFVLLCGGLAGQGKAGRQRSLLSVLLLIAMLVVGWCLLLTKSRTAWVGALAGVMWLIAQVSPGGDGKNSVTRIIRQVGRLLLLIGVPCAVFAAIGILVGVIDAEVLLESPRSLQFRFFYWMGASGIIGESPVFGAGPGNFRQLYLAHKLVESSEMVLDPHNIVLDAWCFAGIVGFAGVVLLIIGIVRSAVEATNCLSKNVSGTLDAPVPRDFSVLPESSRHFFQPPGKRSECDGMPRSVTFGILLGFVVHFGWHWLTGGAFGAQQAMVAVALAVAGFWSRFMRGVVPDSASPSAAAVALLVHLMGAGGLQISVMGYLLIVLAVTSVAPNSNVADRRANNLLGRIGASISGAAGFAVAGAILIYGLLPVMSSVLDVRIGQQHLHANRLQRALQSFERAAATDPLSPDPRQQIARALTYRLMQRGFLAGGGAAPDSAVEAEAALAACERWIAADRRSISGFVNRAEICHIMYGISGNPEHIRSCVRDLETVVSRYPTSALFQAQLSVRRSTAGDSEGARRAAIEARQIDGVNQKWGHRDQFLSADYLETIDLILSSSAQ